MLKVKTFRSEAKGLADLLQPACLPSPNIVLGKDGSLTTFLYYLGPDVDSSTPEELNILSARINAAIAKLGNGWMLKTDIIRCSVDTYPFPENAFPDPITQKIDNERRAMFNSQGVQYESANVLSLTYLPPLNLESRFYTFLIDDPTSDKSQNFASKHLAYFEECVGRIMMDLSSAIHLHRFQNQQTKDERGNEVVYDQTLQFMNFVITGKNHPIRLPSCPMYIDAILGNQDFVGGLKPRIGKKHIKVIAIDGFPENGEPAILRRLSIVGCEYRWNTRFIFMDRQEARSELESYRKKWKQKIRGFKDQIFQTNNGPVDEDAQTKVAELNNAIGIAEGGDVTWGYFTSVIILMDENQSKLEKESKEIIRAISDCGFSCREEDINAVEAWLGSLPCHSLENVRRPVMHTLNTSDLLPVTSVWAGDRFNPSPLFPKNSPALFQAFTSGDTPFFGNLHVGDVGHTLLIGPTGSGKSSMLSFLNAQFRRYPGAKVFSFDQKYSQYALCMGVKGKHYDIGGSDKSLKFCPLANIHKSDKEMAWAEEWIISACEYQGFKIESHHKTEIHNALVNLANGSERSMTDFSTTVQDRQIRDVIRHYTLDGALKFMDGVTDDFELADFTVIEIENLMNMKPNNAVPVLEYLFHRIDMIQDGSVPALMPLDEAWGALQHPVFRAKIREWLKLKRSSNVAVVLATQSISDASGSGIMDVLHESCHTKIFLANAQAGTDASVGFYRELGCNAKEISIIASLTPKRQYYIKTPYGSRVVDLGIGRYSINWLGASAKETVNKLKHLISERPNDWVQIWENQQ